MKKYLTILAVMTVLIVTNQAVGQSTLLEWNFSALPSKGTEVSYNATTSSSNFDLTTLYRGKGAIVKAGCANAFVGEFTRSGSLNEAMENDAYFEVRLFRKDNTLVSLSSIAFSIRSQTYAPRYYQWAYIINSEAPVMIGSPVLIPESEICTSSSVNNSGVAQPSLSLEGIEELQRVLAGQSVALRLYAWGAPEIPVDATSPDYVNFGFGKSTSSVASLVIKGTTTDFIYPLAWSFYGSKGTEANYSATSSDYNIEAPTLFRGAGAQPGGGNSNGFSGTLTVSSDLNEAQANNAYYEFEVKARNSASISFTSLDAIIRTQTYSANTYQWFYKVNDGAFTSIGSPVIISKEETHAADNSAANNGFGQPSVLLSGIADLQNVPSSSSVAFRLYAWGGSTPAEDATDKTYVNFGFGKSSSATAVPALVVNASVAGGESPTEDVLVAGWNFGSLTGITYGDVAATTNDGNLNPSLLSRGEGLAGGSLARSFAARDTLLLTSESEAVNNNAYFELTVEPKDGYKLNLSKLKYRFRKASTSGPTDYVWKYSLDGTTFHPVAYGLITSIETDGVIMPVLDLSSVSELQYCNSKVTLRMYVWGATAVNVFGFGRLASGDASNTINLYGSTTISTGLDAFSLANSDLRVIAGENLAIYSQQPLEQSASVKIVDLTGRVLYRQTVALLAGENTINLPVNLQKGIYIASLEYANGKADHVKFAK